MDAKVYWYIVTYPDGKKQHAIVDDSYVTVQFQNQHHYFEAEAYHLFKWCTDLGFSLEAGVKTIQLP